MAANAPKPMRYDGIQCLRAFASIMVLWAHLKFAAYFGPSRFVASASGASGVDIFFVISGFVIAISAEKLSYNWSEFLRRRFCRVVPFYWLMSLLCFAVVTHSLHVPREQLINTFIFLPILAHSAFFTTMHTFGWTISFEIWFYLLFALLMAIVGRRAGRYLVGLLCAGTLAVALGYHHTYFLPRFLFNPITLEFAAGVVLYRFRARLGAWSVPVAASATLFFFLFTLRTSSLGWYDRVLASPRLGAERDLFWGGFAVSLVALSVALDQAYSLRWPLWWRRLGDASYSLYLMQPMALDVAARVNHHFQFRQPYLASAAYVLTDIVGGLLLSRWIEFPLTHWAARIWKPGRASPRLVPVRS